MYKRQPLVELILYYSASIDEKGSDGATPLIWAASQGHTDVVKILLNKGANPLIEDDHGKTALVHALLKNHLQSAQLLYKGGADLNINLLYAAKRGFPEMVSYLLKQGADHSWITEKQETPLILASLAKNHKCAEILLKQGADPDWTDQNSLSALNHAVMNGDLEMVNLLLVHSADPNSTGAQGNTSLMNAVSHG